MMLLTWRVQLPAPRISICTSSGPTTIGSRAMPGPCRSAAPGRCATTDGVPGQRPADDPGGGAGRQVGAPGHTLEDATAGLARLEARRRSKAISMPPPEIVTTAASWSGESSEHHLALGQPEGSKREVAPARPGRIGGDDAVGAGLDVEHLGGQPGRQLRWVDRQLEGLIGAGHRRASVLPGLRAKPRRSHRATGIAAAAHESRGHDRPGRIAPLERDGRIEARRAARPRMPR